MATGGRGKTHRRRPKLAKLLLGHLLSNGPASPPGRSRFRSLQSSGRSVGDPEARIRPPGGGCRRADSSAATPNSSDSPNRTRPRVGFALLESRAPRRWVEGEIERGGTQGSPSWTHIAGAGFEPATSGL